MVVSAAVAHRIPAGWYQDRDDRTRRRWWNGVEWTEYYAAFTQPILTVVEPVLPVAPTAATTTAATAATAATAQETTQASVTAAHLTKTHQTKTRTAQRIRTTASRRIPFILLGVLSAANAVVLVGLFARL